MTILPLVRIVVFSVSALFSLVVMGLAAGALAMSTSGGEDTYPCEGLAISIALLTLISLPALLVLDRMRSGAFTSMIVVELSWLTLLWVLWLATGASTAALIGNDDSDLADGCDDSSGYWRSLCGQVVAFEAFSFLNWIILFVYSVVVLLFAINAASRGDPVWTSSVKDLTWVGDKTVPVAVVQIEKEAVARPPTTSDHNSIRYSPVRTTEPEPVPLALHPTSLYPSF